MILASLLLSFAVADVVADGVAVATLGSSLSSFSRSSARDESRFLLAAVALLPPFLLDFAALFPEIGVLPFVVLTFVAFPVDFVAAEA